MPLYTASVNTPLYNSIEFRNTDTGSYYKYLHLQPLQFEKDVVYEVTYRLYNTPTSSAPFDLYITASGNSTQSFTKTNEIGKLVAFVTASANTYFEMAHYITADSDGTGSLCLILKYGTYYISDMGVRPYNENNFSLGEMKLQIPTPNSKRGEAISITPVYIGRNGKPIGDVSVILSDAGQTIYGSQYVVVTGSNTVISYGDNIIDGRLFVGGNFNSGVEISGEGGGSMIRSYGYEGFVSAAQDWIPGFILYSGSVLSGSGDYYRGLGFELHAGGTSGSLRYRVDDSGSFLEISGNLYAFNGFFSGTISASTGEIGGWTINANSIYSSKVTESKVTLYSFETCSLGGNYYEFTGLILSTSYGYNGFVAQTGSTDGAILFIASDNQCSASNAPFYVNRNGFLYSSNAYIAGTISASAGYIAGWTLEDITSPYISKKIYSSDNSGSIITLFANYVTTPGPASYTYEGLLIETPDGKKHGFGASTGSVISPFIFVGANSFTPVQNAPFYVTKDGYLSSSLGKVGGWHFDSSSLYNDIYFGNRVILYSYTTTSGGGPKVFNYSGLVLSSSSDGYSAFLLTTASQTDAVLFVGSDTQFSSSNAPFYVQKDGYLYSEYGRIGGWNISTQGGLIESMKSDTFNEMTVSLYSKASQDVGPNSYDYAGLIIQSPEGYSGFIAQTGSMNGAFIFVGSDFEYSASNAAFYVNRNGFVYAKTGSIAEWVIRSGSINSEIVYEKVPTMQAGLRTNIMTDDRTYAGLFLSSSDFNYSGFVARHTNAKHDPFIYVNCPYDTSNSGTSKEMLKYSKFYVLGSGNMVAQQIIASSSLVVCGSAYISGNLNVDGAINASDDITAFSDERLKTNIYQLTHSMDIISNLNGVTFTRIDGDGTQKIGLIAQQIEPYLPQVVRTDDYGYKSISYGNIVALLIEGVKEQQKEIENLKTEINLLKNK